MNRIALIGSFLLASSTFTLMAQEGPNLVPNGSFEDTDGKAKKRGAIESAIGWISPTGARADLFIPGKIVDISVPENFYGRENAKEGNNYAGIVSFSFGNKVARNYIMAKLDEPMKKGMKYCVKMYASLAEGSKYASNNLGICFTDKPLAYEGKELLTEALGYKAAVTHAFNDSKVLNTTSNWDQICGTFTAKGGEKYIVIGNFVADAQVKQEGNKPPKDMKVAPIIASYYYLDNISVQLLEKEEQCNCLISDNKSTYSTMVYQLGLKVNANQTPKQRIESQQSNFGFGKDVISPANKEILDYIAEQLKANPIFKLELIGHSDVEEDTEGLSNAIYAEMGLKRATKLKDYLVEKGIAADRLVISDKGYSEPSQDIYEDDDDEMKQAKNRRVNYRVFQ